MKRTIYIGLAFQISLAASMPAASIAAEPLTGQGSLSSTGSAGPAAPAFSKEFEGFVDLASEINNAIDLIQEIEKSDKYTGSLTKAKDAFKKYSSQSQRLEKRMKASYNYLEITDGKNPTNLARVDKALYRIEEELGKTSDLLDSQATEIADKLGRTKKGIKIELKESIGIGTVIAVAEVGIDFSKKNERIAQGSTETLEYLNMALKLVESFGPPTLPLTSTPSDVGREIINYLGELKERNAAYDSYHATATDGMMEFVQGDASIGAYILRKFQDESFANHVIEVGTDTAYKEVRHEYMQMYADYLSGLYDTKEFFEAEREKSAGNAKLMTGITAGVKIPTIGISLPISILPNEARKASETSIEMFDAHIKGIDMAINALVERSDDIWLRDYGIDLMSSINELNIAKQDLIHDLQEVEKEKAAQDAKLAQLSREMSAITEQATAIIQASESSTEAAVAEKEAVEPQPDFSQNNLMQNQLSAITQGGTSSIGTASYFIGRLPDQGEMTSAITKSDTMRQQSMNIQSQQSAYVELVSPAIDDGNYGIPGFEEGTDYGRPEIGEGMDYGTPVTVEITGQSSQSGVVEAATGNGTGAVLVRPMVSTRASETVNPNIGFASDSGRLSQDSGLNGSFPAQQ